jgi:ankyrin repeat protein
VNAKNSYPPFKADDLGQFFSSSNHSDPVMLLHAQTRADELNTQGVAAQDFKNNGYTPLALAEFASDHTKMIQLLMAHGADANLRGATGTTPLYWSILRDQKDDEKFLLDHGADPNLANMFGDTPLICAIQLGYLSLVQPLVEKNADVNAQNQSLMRALGYAMSNPNDDSIVDYLKKHGAHQ